MIQTTTLAIAGMSCGMCERHVMRAIEGMTGVMDVVVSLPNRQVTVQHLSDWVAAPDLAAALRDAGYSAQPIWHDIYTEPDAGHRTA